MTEATNTIPSRRSIFEIALAITLCIWIVTLMAWALS
jgi:hypothetical protein